MITQVRLLNSLLRVAVSMNIELVGSMRNTELMKKDEKETPGKLYCGLPRASQVSEKFVVMDNFNLLKLVSKFTE